MEFEFDKEMDAILRQARRSGEAVASAGTHLDADEISAFAENTVMGAARTRCTAHLADCTRCRKILSNVILMNSEADTETASSVVSVPVAEKSVPWYRKLFAFPQLAYTMGAFVLLFSGFFAYLLLNNLPGSRNSDVSFSTDKPNQMKESAPVAAPDAASNSNAATTTNSSVPPALSAPSNTTSTTANSAPAPVSNSSSITAATPAPRNENEFVVDGQETQTRPAATPETKPQDQPRREDLDDRLGKVSPAAPTAGGTVSQNRAATEEKQKTENENALLSKDEKNKKLSTERDSQLKSAPMSKTARKEESNAGEARSVGGKTFNNVGGIWFDSAYTKQKQKTVRRGTSDYLRLDSGLRSIADSLGGTVVILWGGKAYRIQ